MCVHETKLTLSYEVTGISVAQRNKVVNVRIMVSSELTINLAIALGDHNNLLLSTYPNSVGEAVYHSEKKETGRTSATLEALAGYEV